jgi:hypothetical protein
MPKESNLAFFIDHNWCDGGGMFGGAGILLELAVELAVDCPNPACGGGGIIGGGGLFYYGCCP